ncbi:YaaC family protein [Planosporangium flavigriseum]
MLRSLRHNPPGWASKGARKATFDAALEQAEQLFTAAQLVTPAASPLLLFYGLSQAGRAVAAAVIGKEYSNQWQLKGHGITNSEANGLTPDTLASLTLQNQGSGSFTQLADILGAASLPTPLPLGDLWCLLPESTRFPLPGMGMAQPIHVSLAAYGVSDEHKTPARVPVPSALMNMVEPTDDPSGVAVNWNHKRAAVRQFLEQFPSLNGWEFTTPEGQPIDVLGYSTEVTQVRIEWRKRPDLSNDKELLRHTVGYRSGHLAFPAIGTDPRPPHPFLLWWAALYALSKLARYEPSLWVKLISVNSSPAAVAIEHILHEAIAVLPELIHRTICEVAASDR